MKQQEQYNQSNSDFAPALKVLLLSDPPDLKITRQTLSKNYKASSHLGDAIFSTTSQIYQMFIHMHNQIVEHSSDITSNHQIVKNFDSSAKLFQLQILRLIERCAAKSLIGALYHSRQSECFFSYAEIPKQVYADIKRIQSKNMLTPLNELEEKSRKLLEQEKIDRVNQERADKHAKAITERSVRIDDNIVKSPPKSPSSLYKMERANLNAEASQRLHNEELEKENKQLQKDLEQALEKIQNLEQAQLNLRISYFKDITQLREQIFVSKKQQNDSFQAIDVRYFDISEGLSPELTKVLNTKLDQMKDSYTTVLDQLKIQNKTLEKKTSVLENMHKEGIKFHDLRVDHLVPRLWEVDQIEINEMKDKNVKAAGYEGAKRLWKLLGKYYGDDYFMEIVEDQFGISNEDNEKIERMINRHIERNKRAFTEKLEKLRDTYETEIKTLKNELRERNHQLNLQRRKVNMVELAITQELNDKAEALAEERATIERESAEYEIERVRRLYEEEADKNNNPIETHRKMQMKFLFKKWQFFAAVVKIREDSGLVDDELKSRLIEVQHDARLQNNDPCGNIRKFAEESRKVRRETAMMEYRLWNEEKLGKSKDRLISEQADLLQAKDDLLDDLRGKIRANDAGHSNIHEQLHSLTHLTNHQAEHIGNLEGRIDRGASSLGGGTGRAKLKLLEAKCSHQDILLQKEMATYLQNMSEGDIKEIWCQTELFGLQENIGLIQEERKPPVEETAAQTRIVKFCETEAQIQAQTQVNECQTDFIDQTNAVESSNLKQKDSILEPTPQKKHTRKSEATKHLAPILQGSVASSAIVDPSSIDQTFGLKFQTGTEEPEAAVGGYRVQNEKMEDSLSTNQHETLPRAMQFRDDSQHPSQVQLSHKYPTPSQQQELSSRPHIRPQKIQLCPSKSNISFQPETMTQRDQMEVMARESRKSILYQIANKGQQVGDLEDVYTADEEQQMMVQMFQQHEPQLKMMRLQTQRNNRLRKKVEKLKGTVQEYEQIIAKLVKASHQQDLYKYLPTRVPQLVKLLSRHSGRMEVEQLLDTNFYSNQKRPRSDNKRYEDRNASPVSGDTKADSCVKFIGENPNRGSQLQSARIQQAASQRKASNIDIRHSQVISSTLSQEAHNELFGQNRMDIREGKKFQPGLSTSSSLVNNPSRYYKDARGFPQMQSQDATIPTSDGVSGAVPRPAFDTLDPGHTSDGQFEQRQTSNISQSNYQAPGLTVSSDVQILTKDQVKAKKKDRYTSNDHPSQSGFSQFDPADSGVNADNATMNAQAMETSQIAILEQNQPATVKSQLETSGQVELSQLNPMQIQGSSNPFAYADKRGGMNSINQHFRENSGSQNTTHVSTQMHQRQVTIQENRVRRSQNYSIRRSQGQMTTLVPSDIARPSYDVQQNPGMLNYPQLAIQTRGQSSLTRHTRLIDNQTKQQNAQAPPNLRQFDFYQHKPPPMDNYEVSLLAGEMANIRNSLQMDANQKRQRMSRKGLPQAAGKTSRRQSSYSKMSASSKSKLAKTQAVRVSQGAPNSGLQTIAVLTGDSGLDHQTIWNHGAQTTKNKVRESQQQHPQFLYSTNRVSGPRSRPIRPMSGVPPKTGGVSRYQIQANVPQTTANAGKLSTQFWPNKPKEGPSTKRKQTEGSDDGQEPQTAGINDRHLRTEIAEIDEEQIYVRNDA